MTTLLSWVGVDSHRVASLYLASDSRITWGTADAWDLGRKVFAARSEPWIMGYCGDVVFPSLLLGQLTDLIDANALFTPAMSLVEKVGVIRTALRTALDAYPPPRRNDFTILLGVRERQRPDPRFHLFETNWSRDRGWQDREVLLPEASNIVTVCGSGEGPLRERFARWGKSDAGGTSRAVFGALCDALDGQRDPRSGGAPQLVRIYPAGPARPVGIIWRDKRYLLGCPVEDVGETDLEWRNATFEVCDPHTMQRQERAKPQPRPGGV